MKTPRLLAFARLFAALLICAALPSAWASDHADPMSLNVFMVQESPEANITDLHAFVVDGAGRPIPDAARLGEGDQLIVSLCVRRALRPDLVGGLELKGFKFRLHLDLAPAVRFFDETKTREGADYDKTLAARTSAVDAALTALDWAKKSGDQAKEAAADKDWKAALTRRGTLIAQHETDRSAQALYGGIITQPDGIAESALLEFEIDLVKDDEKPELSQTYITKTRIEGIPGEVNIAAVEKSVGGKVRIASKDFQPGMINVQTGVFDDPFIFPRFFRRNVVGIVTSIPLSSLPLAARKGPIVLWATSHKGTGEQIDHAGRSLRTQLPRFGYLNTKHPAEHVKEITRVHEHPSVMDDVLATFLAPLEAHRHYDSMPDVMIYDLRRPAKFPNGRWLDDDVSAALAAAGETLLLELSYAESKQFPRATTNDKQFNLKFPYLAPRWTKAEVDAYAQPGTTMPAKDTAAGPALRKDFDVPRPGDSAAIAFANLKDPTWQTLWRVEVIALIALTILLALTVRLKVTRAALVILALIVICLLQAAHAPNLAGNGMEAMAQPAQKISRLLLGGGVLALLTLGWVFALGRRCSACPHEPEPFPPGNQDVTDKDGPASTDSYKAVRDAVFSEPYYGNAWGGPDRRLLPLYRQTVGSILRGLFPLGQRLFLQAANRTVRSRADLRWGEDRKGFRRLLHPMGVCLTGSWRITAAPEGKAYTGYFAKGSEGRIFGRYSTGGSKPWGGHYRSLALVGKIYPPEGQPLSGAPAHFFTQEDLGATYSDNIRKAELTNSPPVSPWNRGKDIGFLLINGLTLLMADAKNSERQLYEIAELGKPEGTDTSCPRFMRLTLSKDTPQVGGDGADFRDEILSILYDRGNPRPTGRKLIFDISVSDVGTKWGRGIEWLTGQDWQPIGQIIFDEAAASYNGDFVIHFHHPVWRTDRNRPGTILRPELRP